MSHALLERVFNVQCEIQLWISITRVRWLSHFWWCMRTSKIKGNRPRGQGVKCKCKCHSRWLFWCMGKFWFTGENTSLTWLMPGTCAPPQHQYHTIKMWQPMAAITQATSKHLSSILVRTRNQVPYCAIMANPPTNRCKSAMFSAPAYQRLLE